MLRLIRPTAAAASSIRLKRDEERDYEKKRSPLIIICYLIAVPMIEYK
jgi:hypothetical protein